MIDNPERRELIRQLHHAAMVTGYGLLDAACTELEALDHADGQAKRIAELQAENADLRADLEFKGGYLRDEIDELKRQLARTAKLIEIMEIEMAKESA